MLICPNCGSDIFPNERTCPDCGKDLGRTRIQASQDIHDTYDPASKDSSSALGASSKKISALTKRYSDAYIVARTTNGLGGAIKGIGVLIGVLLTAGGVMVAGNGGPRDPISYLGIVAAVVGIITGTLFFIVGVLVSAQAQTLKASLDSAVNTSTFLTNDDRARIMSL